MEVHHHPDLHHKSKPWKEYLLEFFMIFLAVTMGFFAENLREHFKDSTEIKSNMQSMVADLQSDVDMYTNYLATNQLSDRRIDTLIEMLKSPEVHTSKIYFLARFITANNSVFTPDTRTFEQMKTSGTLKLIESKEILDSISIYYQSIHFFISQNPLQGQKVSDVHLANSQLFNGYIFQHMFANVDSNINVEIAEPANNPPLMTNDLIVINKVIMAYHYLYGTTEINNKAASVNLQNVKNLIHLIKQHYQLK